ncbi:YibE/F family protein [Cryptosporangium japonicum]|uniref:YibE/F family protein n=1 Tax=Cryptosporangium japonicum TaxID=80872 RepID=A0ABN0UKQ0_9ACTN
MRVRLRGVWRPVLVVIVPIALLTIVGMVWLWPSGAGTAPDRTQYVNATVRTIVHAPCASDDEAARAAGQTDCGAVVVRVTSGPDTNQDVTTDVPSGPGAPALHEGDDVVLLYLPDTPVGETYQIADHQRGGQLWVLGAAFVLAVVAFGRWRGLSALAGLAVTFAVLLLFVVPAILDGEPPLLVAIVGSAAIMLTVLYLTHGVGTSTSVAVIGTLTSLALTGALSWLAVRALHLTGVADEQASYLGVTHDVNLQGLLLAGILIGSLGVLDDVTVTQAATVGELARANPAYRFTPLYRAANRVGRAHIASVVNTIILAYAGASLPLLILITDSGQSLGRVLTNQLVAQELVRSVVGTLGLISAVPITTALAAFTARRRPRAETEADDAPRTDHLSALAREEHDSAW